MSHRVFISYAQPDATTATTICEALESSEISCWIAPRNIPTSTPWGEAIVDAITTSRLLVLILSEGSNESPYVLREVERAVSKRVPLLAFRIEPVVLSPSLEFFLSAVHWMEAHAAPSGEQVARLVEATSRLVSADSPANAPLPGHNAPLTHAMSDEAILRELYVCFDRPAFRESFEHETDLEALMVALEDTVAAINTGVKRRRDGIVFGQPVPGKAYLRGRYVRDALDTIVSILTETRRIYRQALRDGCFFDLYDLRTVDRESPTRDPSESPHAIAFHRDHQEEATRVAVKIDVLRNRVLEIANEVFGPLGLPSFPYIETPDRYLRGPLR